MERAILRSGGGALSGKDFYKADRAGAIIARRLAKAAVLTGVARECTAILAFLPGKEQALLISLRDQNGQELDNARWSRVLDRMGASTKISPATRTSIH